MRNGYYTAEIRSVRLAQPPKCSPAISISDATRPEHSARNRGSGCSSALPVPASWSSIFFSCSFLLYLRTAKTLLLYYHVLAAALSTSLAASSPHPFPGSSPLLREPCYHACGYTFFHHVPAKSPWAAVDRWVPAGNARKSMPGAGRLDGVSFRQSARIEQLLSSQKQD